MRGMGRRHFVPAVVAAAVVAAVWFGYSEYRDYNIGRQLILATPDSIPSNPQLVSYAEEIGRRAYVANCASCHGMDLRGNQNGVPNLSDSTWLYDYGRVSDIGKIAYASSRSYSTRNSAAAARVDTASTTSTASARTGRGSAGSSRTRTSPSSRSRRSTAGSSGGSTRRKKIRTTWSRHAYHALGGR